MPNIMSEKMSNVMSDKKCQIEISEKIVKGGRGCWKSEPRRARQIIIKKKIFDVSTKEKSNIAA